MSKLVTVSVGNRIFLRSDGDALGSPSPRATHGERVAEGSEGRSLGQIAAALAPHPSLRATFSPRCGEKENQIKATAGHRRSLSPCHARGEGGRRPGEGRSSGQIAATLAPYPSLRATFSPLCGEKENKIKATAGHRRSLSPCHARGEGGRRPGEGRSLVQIAAALAPHPSLRATFSPLCGEKGNLIRCSEMCVVEMSGVQNAANSIKRYRGL